jgi:hypothetical protein
MGCWQLLFGTIVIWLLGLSHEELNLSIEVWTYRLILFFSSLWGVVDSFSLMTSTLTF